MNAVNLHWMWIRLLQKTKIYNPFMATMAGFKVYVSDPPGAAAFFSRRQLEESFLSDPSIVATLSLTKTARTFWDIGANIGLYSLLAINNNPRLTVLSVEPSSEHFQALCMNRRETPHSGWTLLNLAIGDKRGTARMTRALGGLNHILKDSAPPESKYGEELCLMSTLDDIADWSETPHIDVLKIDVEGFEPAVLRGAQRLLASGRIGSIIIESDGHESRYGEKPRSIDDLMRRHNYRIDQQLTVSGNSSGNCSVYMHGLHGTDEASTD